MSLEFPSIETLAARGTRKWTVFEPDVLPVWIAESDFPTAPAIMDCLREHVEKECLGYTPAPHTSGLAEAVSGFYSRHFGWKPEPQRIFAIGDVVRAMLLGVQYFTREGSAVAVPVPSYPPLLEIPATAGRERILCELSLDSIEHAFAQGAGCVLLANPYNPTGSVASREFLTGLVELAQKYDARIIADEIHAPLVYDGTHIPVASLGAEAAARTITVTSTSKAFNIAGLKCAQVIFSNDADVATWNSLTGVAKDGTGTLGVVASVAAFNECDDFLAQEIDILRANRDFAVSLLKEKIPGLKVSAPAATYLLWLDWRETSIPDKEHPARWLRTHARVAMNEGTDFGEVGAGHTRFNFATSREVITEAVERLAAAVS